MRRLRKNITTSEEEESPDLTPLIDVVFVVLILFMILAPLVELDQVRIAEGPHEKSDPMELHKKSIKVYIRNDGSIYLDRAKMQEASLKEELSRQHAADPQKRLQVICDQKAPFGMYQTAKNAASFAGFEELDVVLSGG